MMFRGITLTVKNPAYKEECEWRLIYSPLITENAAHEVQILGKCSEMNFRTTKYGVFPYFRLPFTVPAIKEVILGPKNHTPIELVKLWLYTHGHRGAEVNKSKASYR